MDVGTRTSTLTMTRLPILFVLLLVVSSVVPALSTASNSSDVQRVNMDADNPLASEQAVSEYSDSGSVSRNLTRYDMQMAYYNDAKHISWFNPSPAAEVSHEWLVVCYNEDIPREFRFYAPDTYFTPVTEDTVQSRTGTATASFTPTSERANTAIVVKFSGPGCHAFGINTADAFVFGHVEKAKSRVEDIAGTDWDVPGLSGSVEWSHINGHQLDNQTAVPINASIDDLTVQYQTTVRGETTWVPVPDEQTKADPVYLMTKNGSDETYVVSTVSDAPQVRYRTGGDGVGGSISSAINDILSSFAATVNDIRSLFG